MVLSNAEKQRRFREKRDLYFKVLKEKLKERSVVIDQSIDSIYEMNCYYNETNKGDFMMYSVFCIFDSGIQTWLPPIYARNKGDMLRQFSDAVNNPQSNLFKHPGDYTLFEVGKWNDDKCEFDLLKTPLKLGVAIEFVKQGGVSPAVSPSTE